MEPKQITPNEFSKRKAEYEAALLARQEAVQLQRKQGMKQQEIADFWGVDISKINRILKRTTAVKHRRPKTLEKLGRPVDVGRIRGPA
jgi:DNA-directed RNA polymerase specialized sigma24 family protein